ncbi:fibropellin-1-like [Lytechinus variegatus]|uniref:fibropellin-1-like n=1 Tax=Lytechinus variegatus TaxID=7654 RepID=UPI001BB19162|nr:fibropellin-1-like [Lytechinus variegatus]
MSSNILGFYLLLASVSMLCICIDGLTFCDDNTDCRNGGVCSSMNVCECTPTWTGPTCESPNPCGSSPCLHGGTCEANGGNYTCLCRTPHKGTNCEYLAASSSCDPTPCVAGECIDDLNGNVYCECTPFTTGAFCERTPNCSNRDPCRHGGVCVDGQTANDSSSCDCNND